MKIIKRVLLILTLIPIVAFIFFVQKPKDITFEDSGVNTDIYSNLEAFSKLYGIIRYFHPSDEAYHLDWEIFAIYGVQKIKSVKNETELKETLEELFHPIAPTLKISFNNEEYVQKAINDKNKTIIFWQHDGYGLGTMDRLYESKRITADIKDGNYLLDKSSLFPTYPNEGETTKTQISPNLTCYVPLVLYKDKNGTVGENEVSEEKYEELLRNLDEMDPSLTSQNVDVRYAGTIVTWNVLQHFYPYFDTVDVDWNSQLRTSLVETTDNQNRLDYIHTLTRLLEKTKDGHASFSFDEQLLDSKRLPFTLDIIDQEVIVSASLKDSPVKRGDIVISINDELASEFLNKIGDTVPGSAQFKQYRSIKYFKALEHVKIKIKREDKVIETNIDSKEFVSVDDFERTNPFMEIEEGIFYINLKLDIEKDFYENIDKLVDAKGIIFDLRGYLDSFFFMRDLIGHLTEKTITGPRGKIMQVIYPNQKNVTYKEEKDEIENKLPYLGNSKITFLSYAGSASQPEYFLGYVKNNNLAKIIGQPTAGCDGDVQTYPIPGNLMGMFTGMEIINADNTPQHLIGIQPDIYVERTIEGVQKGEDEYITAALKWIKGF